MKTIRVRIAVAVNDKGQWNAAGWGLNGTAADDVMSGEAMDGLPGRLLTPYCFIEANIPVPESQTIEGKVMP